jgi:hypothetical protein
VHLYLLPVPVRTSAHANQLVHVQENPDLFKWLTGQQEAPSDLSSNRAYQVKTLGFSRPTRTLCASNEASESHTKGRQHLGTQWVA